ncbi:MAG: ABC transporter substrate-binding protein, partial [Ancalomicrobiaceae bacterium]|nr:ABC transporter substrate-binding protein [Ancalomicrobiaceae bacterium]
RGGGGAAGAAFAPMLPKEYFAGDRDLYVQALDAGKGMFTPDGEMPDDGPATVLAVLSGFSKNVKGKSIDLAKSYTTEFVKAAK